MKILITGAYGFVGTNLSRYLVSKGHECVALDMPKARRDDVPYKVFHSWDELDSIDWAGIDAVVHLAGKAHDLKNVSDPQSYFDINVGLTEKIFAWYAKKVEVEGGGGRRTFVYFSSSKASPDGNAYGRSKYAAEEYLKNATHPSSTSTSNLNLCILRPAMIHGPGNKGNLNLLWGIARRGFPWPLAAFENRRSFTSIGNICASVEALCERGENGVYPIADDEMLSTNHLIELMAEVCGRKPHLWSLPKRLMRFAAKVGDVLHLPLNTERLGKLTEDSFVDNTALKKHLGWNEMPIRAEDGMRETLKSFLIG